MGKKRSKFVKLTGRIPSDDFELEGEDGTVHYPHAGEWIVLRADMPWSLMQIGPNMTNQAFCYLVIKILQRQIREWSWTGDDEESLPAPADKAAFEACLWNLGKGERDYLYSQVLALGQLPNA